MCVLLPPRASTGAPRGLWPHPEQCLSQPQLLSRPPHVLVLSRCWEGALNGSALVHKFTCNLSFRIIFPLSASKIIVNHCYR